MSSHNQPTTKVRFSHNVSRPILATWLNWLIVVTAIAILILHPAENTFRLWHQLVMYNPRGWEIKFLKTWKALFLIQDLALKLLHTVYFWCVLLYNIKEMIGQGTIIVWNIFIKNIAYNLKNFNKKMLYQPRRINSYSQLSPCKRNARRQATPLTVLINSILRDVSRGR